MGEDSEWFKVRHRNFDVFAEEVIDDKIKVSVDLLLQEFECPVCFNLNDDAYITKCGHTFCGSCITKWIQQSQNCPHCKEPLLPTDTTKDRRSDQILSVLLNAKSQAATEYIKNLVHKGCQLDDLDVEDDLRNPIENIFSLNVQESLAKFREYFTDMKRNFRKMCKQSTSENEIKMIENAHQIQINALLETYDTYMKSMEPKIDLLPI